jgi:ribonuclease P protein component
MTTNAPAEAASAATPPKRLQRRSEFLRAAASGAQHHARAFKLQMAKRSDDAPARFGFTVTKKVAGAVGRNRIRRRLREAARLQGALVARAGCDYVFIARGAALTAPFAELCAQMTDAIVRLNRRGAMTDRRNIKDRPGAP